jgi:L-ribulose-5-phosphate 4-epimerase
MVLYTFGNARGISSKDGLITIKPSGIPYERLSAEHMVTTIPDGQIMGCEFRPSSDLPTHLEICKQFANWGGVAHTRSEFATACAQVCRPVRCFGTTHADSFHGEIPITRCLTPDEIASDYEKNTRIIICRHFNEVDPDRDKIFFASTVKTPTTARKKLND